MNSTFTEVVPFIASDWPATGSKLYFATAQGDASGDIWQATWISEPDAVPATSHWSLAALTLLVLTFGTVVVGRRRQAVA